MMSTRRPVIVTEDETLENLKNTMEREMGKFNNSDMLAAAKEELKDEPQDRSSVVKNLSLMLLDIEQPTQILDIFARDYLGQNHDNVYVEELFMLLYFFKTTIREWQEESAKELIRTDYRINALIGMVMDKYTSNTDFAYQLSTIQALTSLNTFYDLVLTDSWKDKLVDSLVESKFDSASFTSEIPSLLFSMQALATDRNIDDIRSLVEALSMVYLQVIGERIDVASASHLMFAWTNTDTINEGLIQTLITLCMAKEDLGEFYEHGCSTELINIVKSLQQMGVKNDAFLGLVLNHITASFDEVPITWIATLLKSLGQANCEPQLVCDFFT